MRYCATCKHDLPLQTVLLKPVQVFEMIVPDSHALQAAQFLPVALKKPLLHVQSLLKEGAGWSAQFEFDPHGDVAQASMSASSS